MNQNPQNIISSWGNAFCKKKYSKFIGSNWVAGDGKILCAAKLVISVHLNELVCMFVVVCVWER